MMNYYAKQRLKESIQEVKNNFPHLETCLPYGNRSFLYTGICQYIVQLEKLVDSMIKRRRQWKYRCFQSPLVYDNSYMRVVSAFGTMCGLEVEEGDEGNLSIWNHLRGINKTVISKPDLRFHCTGEDFSRKNNLGLLNITEVKNKGRYSKAKCKRKHESGQSTRGKRKRYSVSYSSSSSSSETNQSDEILSVSDSNRGKRKQITVSSSSSSSSSLTNQSDENLPTTESLSIEYDIGEHVLGQHAGELLLDLHTYMEQHESKQQPSKLTMPGIIINKTMVTLTLLEISYQHYGKLACAEKLTIEDRAAIYYSHPKDLLDEHTMPIVVDAFVKLNNIESIIKYPD